MKDHKYRDFIAWGITAFITIVLCILFFFAIYKLQDLHAFGQTISAILQPISIGAVMAYVLTPVYNRVRRRLTSLLTKTLGRERLARRLASGGGVAASLLLIILVMYGLIAAVVPELVRNILRIVASTDVYFATISDWFDEFMAQDTIYTPYVQALIDNAGTYLNDWLNNTILPNLNNYLVNLSVGVVQVVVAIVNLLIGLIVTAYLLSCKDTLCAQSKKIIYGVFNLPAANLIISKFRYAHQVFGGFINGQLLDSLLVGIICFIGCTLLGVPYAMLVSVVVGVTNIIPFFGPFIGAIPSAFLILLNDPLKALVFLVFILVLQQVDGNIIVPKILGGTTGLSSFWVLFSILLFGGLFGFIGMIVGVPLFAVVYSLIKDLISWRLDRKDLSQDTRDYRSLYAITPQGYEYRDPAPRLVPHRSGDIADSAKGADPQEEEDDPKSAP